MEASIRRELRLLRAWAIVSAAGFVVFALAAFRRQERPQRFGVIEVERINIVEPDGTPRLVLSNRARSPGPISRGRPFGYPGGGRPGIIFYNDEGTENGGLTFSGRRDSAGKVSATGHFSFDQFDQDQVVYLQYLEGDGRRLMGLTVADRAEVDIYDWVLRRDSISQMPDGEAKTEALERLRVPVDGVPLFARRLFAGRDRSRAAVIDLADPQGRSRLRLRVDSAGEPSLEFLDADGRVTLRLPQ